jgi:hypothetical protein
MSWLYFNYIVKENTMILIGIFFQKILWYLGKKKKQYEHKIGWKNWTGSTIIEEHNREKTN